MTVTIMFAGCFHSETVEARPNPRKAWPDPRTCPVCRKKRSVCEIRYRQGGASVEEVVTDDSVAVS